MPDLNRISRGYFVMVSGDSTHVGDTPCCGRDGQSVLVDTGPWLNILEVTVLNVS